MARDEHDARMKNDPEYRESYLRKRDLEAKLDEVSKLADQAEREYFLDQLQEVGQVFEPKAPQTPRMRQLSTFDFALRSGPYTDEPSWSRKLLPRYSRTAQVTHWGVGDVVRANNIWFYCIVGDVTGWIWSGSFEPEDRGFSGLPKKKPAPRPEATSDNLDDFFTPDPSDRVVEVYSEGRVTQVNHFALAFEQMMKDPISAPARKKSRKLQHSSEEERRIQSRMAYRIGPDRWFGWVVTVDTAKGKTREYWRLTREAAERVGHKKLERNVLRRRRMYDAANPKTVTAMDRWIVEPTQAEQTAKEIADWDAQFRGEGEK